MDKYDTVVTSLQKRSQQVLPLRFRRETPLQPTAVEALCDYDGDQVHTPSLQQELPGAHLWALQEMAD